MSLRLRVTFKGRLRPSRTDFPSRPSDQADNCFSQFDLNIFKKSMQRHRSHQSRYFQHFFLPRNERNPSSSLQNDKYSSGNWRLCDVTKGTILARCIDDWFVCSRGKNKEVEMSCWVAVCVCRWWSASWRRWRTCYRGPTPYLSARSAWSHWKQVRPKRNIYCCLLTHSLWNLSWMNETCPWS